MSPEADETIITRFVAETSEATKNIQSLREVTDSIKVQLKSLAKDTKESLELVAAGLEKAFKTERLAQLREELKSVIRPEDTKGLVEQAKADIKDYSTAMKAAIKEIRTEQTAYTKEVSQQAKIQSEARKQEEQQAKQAAKNIAAADKEKQKAARDAANEIIRNNQQQAAAIKHLDSQVKESGKTFRLFGQEIKGVGDIARAVFIGLFGVTLISILRNVARWFSETTKAGLEFVRAMYNMEIGVRALQRSGVEITIQDVYENIDRLGKRFGVFSRQELVEGSAALINLVRDFGFTKEQIFELQEAIATLAIVNKRSMDEVQRTVALAISSGYTEGLQRLGVSLNRVVIAEKAAALGYADSYMALTELQRAEATRLLTLEKTAKYDQDAITLQERQAGATDKLAATWQNYTTRVGTALGKATAGFAYLLATFLGLAEASEDVQREGNIILRMWETLGSASAALAKFVSEMWKVLRGEEDFRQAIANFRQFSQEWRQGLEDLAPADTEMERIQEVVSDSLEDLEQFQKEYADKIRDIETDYLRDIEKLERDAGRRRLELARDLARDLAEIERDGLQRREDLQRNYFDNLRKIGEDLARDIAEETAKYNMAVAQTIRDFALRRQEAEARYRENEIKAEIRFQEEMRRLREGFLFDLEDALHERDARQVLRLIRQYNLQKDQAERQFEIERDERRRAFELEMQELEAQRQERLRILAEEHAARLAALQEQAAYERELARRKYEEDKAELERKLEEEKQERIAKALEAEEELARRLEEAKTDRKALLDQQVADLEAERDRLLQEIGDKLWNSLQITTDEGLKQLYDALVATLGDGGDADAVFRYYASSAERAAIEVEGSLTRVAAMMAQIYAFAAQLSSIPSVPPPGGGGGGSTPIPNPSPERQFGGEVYKGQIYKVHKDETYVPAMNGRILDVQDSKEAVAQAFSGAGRGGGGEGKVKIGIALSDGLVGEIIDMAGDAVADVVFELERKRT